MIVLARAVILGRAPRRLNQYDGRHAGKMKGFAILR